MLNQLTKNKKGQTVIFIVLIFQVLFILFAMSLNVGMVVYDKINLQNSLDLATYYGAKKQAEVLNAMAHINYQMRQNWKLLAWRYRILGTLVQYEGRSAERGEKDYWCPQNSTNTINCSSSSSPECRASQTQFRLTGIYPEYCDNSYFTCISHDLWKRGVESGDQNLCRQSNVSITPIRELPLIAPFLPEARIAERAVDLLRDEVGQSCPLEGGLNWLMTQLFLTHFRLDQKDRKGMLKELYNKTLKEGKDLDNKDIFEGAKKVFIGNLTKVNFHNLKDLADYSLEEFQAFKEKEFEEIFKRLDVQPILLYANVDAISESDSTRCTVESVPHLETLSSDTRQTLLDFINTRFSRPPHGLLNYLRKENILNLFELNRTFKEENEDFLATLTASFFKEREEILYYGLRSEFDYKDQIFSLNLGSGIKFKASSFAKAFGASFGPQPEQHDPFIPTNNDKAPTKFVTDRSFLTYVHQPNFSRWPGDPWGLVDLQLHDPDSQFIFLNKQKDYKDTQQVYKMEDYFHIIFFNSPDDPLARNLPLNEGHDPFRFTRLMEWLAIYPNMYDISYYSILANYHQTYFPKICNLLTGSDCEAEKSSSFSLGDNVFYVRGDFGWSDSEKYINENSRLKEIELSIAPFFLIDNLRPNINLAPSSPLELKARIFGTHSSSNLNSVRKQPPLIRTNVFNQPWFANPLPDFLLSSWFNPSPLNYTNYDHQMNNFLTCQFKAEEGQRVPSSCVGRGRTGYSVKLISCNMVRTFKSKPDTINEFCPP
ncbi:MAG: hypothetical protein GDA46_00150 [Bdellovibrionales bacterium]|nr:hypothetical protein [Bdellovibrionales bacterium]